MRESNRHLHIIFNDNYYDDFDDYDHFDDYSDCDDFDDLNDDDCEDPGDDYDHGLVGDKSNRPCHQMLKDQDLNGP